MADLGGRIADRCDVQDLIGRGGMGDVYRSVDTETGEPVAIKLLHEDIVEENPGIVDRFKREGEALRRLNHPNIVNILDTVEAEGKHYLVMEYVSGGSLRDLIDELLRIGVHGRQSAYHRRQQRHLIQLVVDASLRALLAAYETHGIRLSFVPSGGVHPVTRW